MSDFPEKVRQILAAGDEEYFFSAGDEVASYYDEDTGLGWRVEVKPGAQGPPFYWGVVYKRDIDDEGQADTLEEAKAQAQASFDAIRPDYLEEDEDDE